MRTARVVRSFREWDQFGAGTGLERHTCTAVPMKVLAIYSTAVRTSTLDLGVPTSTRILDLARDP